MGTPGGEGSPTDLGHLDSSTSGNLPDSPYLLHHLCRHTWEDTSSPLPSTSETRSRNLNIHENCVSETSVTLPQVML